MKHTAMKIVGLAFLTFLATSSVAQAEVSIAPLLRQKPVSDLCQQVQRIARPGDLIYVAFGNVLYQYLSESTQSWTSHVGVLLPDEKGKLVVYESNFPTTRTSSLCAFVDRSMGLKVEVKRFRQALSAGNIEQLRKGSMARLGTRYDTGFDLDGNGEFCSKFIYEIFRETLSVQVGKIETFQQLLDSNPKKDLQKFWKAWFFGDIPWNRRTITPGSQNRDTQFARIYSHNLDQLGQ